MILSLKHRDAFTLVELSIVLVILGLLIGGVLTGQSLIRAAELRSVATQEARYITATQTFRDKYFALPGDMTNAQSYWGIANATPATCITTVSTDSKTCNGDGNGMIDLSAGSDEYFRYWQQLANAGLIEGSYTGAPASTSTNSASTANCPSGRVNSSLWFANNRGAVTPATDGAVLFDGQYDNTMDNGAFTNNGIPAAVIFKPEELYNIDMKVDDGKPATGKLVMRGTYASCTDGTSSTSYNANYLLSSTSVACSLVFRQVF